MHKIEEQRTKSLQNKIKMLERESYKYRIKEWQVEWDNSLNPNQKLDVIARMLGLKP